MVIFHSYVKLPEGTACYRLLFVPSFFLFDHVFYASFTSLLEGGWRRFEDYTISRIFGLVTSD